MLINKAPMADMMLRKVGDSKTVVVDVETSGLDWYRNHIIGWVLTIGPGPEDTFYVPVRHAGGGNLPADINVPRHADGWRGDIHPIEPRILNALENKFLIFHNGSFDMKFMHRVGWNSRSCTTADTMIGCFLTNEIRPSLSLDACCRDENVQAKKGDSLYTRIAELQGVSADKSSMGVLWKCAGDDDIVVDYGSGDGTSTWQLWEKIQPKLEKPYYSNEKREFSLKSIAKVEFDLMTVLHRMSMRGVKVNQQNLELIYKKTKEDFEKGMTAIGDLNVRSPLQLKTYFEKHGETTWPLTEKGSPSFAEEWLKSTEPGRHILAVRKNRTLIDNFLAPLMGRWQINGRVHVNFHQTRDEEFGTRTGRLSTTDPNMGAMPGKRQGDLGKRFRGAFEADDDYEFTEGDYSNCEIRIAADYCQAKAWVNGLRSGIDPHTSVANEINIERKSAKTINLALMTGSGKKAIAAKLRLPLAEAEAIVDKYFDGLPELKKFQKDSSRIFESRGFVSTYLGRRLQLADRNKGYTAVNRLTQGGNADIVKSAMVQMDKVEGINMHLTVYDSALFSHATGDHKSRLKAIEVMADMAGLGIPKFSLPMKVEYGTGKTWADATFSEQQLEHSWQPLN